MKRVCVCPTWWPSILEELYLYQRLGPFTGMCKYKCIWVLVVLTFRLLPSLIILGWWAVGREEYISISVCKRNVSWLTLLLHLQAMAHSLREICLQSISSTAVWTKETKICSCGNENMLETNPERFSVPNITPIIIVSSIKGNWNLQCNLTCMNDIYLTLPNRQNAAL